MGSPDVPAPACTLVAEYSSNVNCGWGAAVGAHDSVYGGTAYVTEAGYFLPIQYPSGGSSSSSHSTSPQCSSHTLSNPHASSLFFSGSLTVMRTFFGHLGREKTAFMISSEWEPLNQGTGLVQSSPLLFNPSISNCTFIVTLSGMDAPWPNSSDSFIVCVYSESANAWVGARVGAHEGKKGTSISIVSLALAPIHQSIQSLSALLPPATVASLPLGLWARISSWLAHSGCVTHTFQNPQLSISGSATRRARSGQAVSEKVRSFVSDASAPPSK
mmetsp:Transcript_43179/g.82358  ORF Transcript_43179/g.82358 Transcript_43179/m.82358 type:complete len:273 (-) Transcript_43179:348-1166(-)